MTFGCASGAACGGVCTNLSYDTSHCGSCGNVCERSSLSECAGARVTRCAREGACNSGTCDHSAVETSCLGGPCADDRCPPAVIAEIAANENRVCARALTGSVACWGVDWWGARPSYPPVVVPGVSDAVHIALAGYYACALRAGGAVACWGYRGGPVTEVDVTGVTQLTGWGDGRMCGRRSNGTVVCWYEGDPPLDRGLADVVEVEGDWTVHNLCARRSDGSVVCQSYSGTVDPSLAAPVLGDATQIAVGESHACALRAGGSVVCWGSDYYGQLGDGATVEAGTATVSGLTDAVEIVAGRVHNCARRASGSVVCWGNNDQGQLGDGTLRDRHVPTAVAGLTGAAQLAAGSVTSSWGGFTCAVRTGGTIACWGGNDDTLTPVTVTGF